MGKKTSEPSTEYVEAESVGENNKLPPFPMSVPKNDFEHKQRQSEILTKYHKMWNVAGGKRRRKSRKKKHRRRRRSRKRSRERSRKRRGGDVVTIHRLPDDLIAKLPAKAKAKAMPYFSKINEIISTEGNWIDAQKSAAGGRRRRRRRQRGGQRGDYGKPGIGSEDSLCGAYQTPEESQYTPDKYIVVPQPTGSSGGALEANDITIGLAKAFTQAKANSEGDFSVVDTELQDDRQKIGLGPNEKVDADQGPPEVKLSGTQAAIDAAEKARRAAESAAAAAGGQVAATVAAKSAASAAAKAIPAARMATASAIQKISQAGEAVAARTKSAAAAGGGGGVGGGALGGMLGSAAKSFLGGSDSGGGLGDELGGMAKSFLSGGRRKSRRKRRRRKSRKKKHRRRRTRRRRRRRRSCRR